MTRTALALAVTVLLGLAACGGESNGTQTRHSTRAADQCAGRIGVQRVDAPEGPGIGASAKPFYAATVVGVSGEPPTALGFGDPASGASVTFAIVPASANPSRSSTFGAISADGVGASYLTVPQAKLVEVERCLGGSATG